MFELVGLFAFLEIKEFICLFRFLKKLFTKEGSDHLRDDLVPHLASLGWSAPLVYFKKKNLKTKLTVQMAKRLVLSMLWKLNFKKINLFYF